MSNSRQRSTPPKSPDGLLVRTFAVSYSSGHRIHAHSHDWDQLLYASGGVMTIDTSEGSWVVPPHRAVWIPAGVEHSVWMSGPVSMRTLYLLPGLSGEMPRNCCTVNVPALLRELIHEAVARGTLAEDVPSDVRLAGVILDQFAVLPAVPLQLPIPRDPRARKVAELLQADPSPNTPLSRVARQAGASARTLERLFRSETNMSFGKWRQRLRLLHALRLLAAGEPVTSVALGAGYSSPSAFISMFRRELGTTPSRYHADGHMPGLVQSTKSAVRWR